MVIATIASQAGLTLCDGWSSYCHDELSNLLVKADMTGQDDLSTQT
jgi:hypothetical protein